jgi:ribonuclease HII
MNANNSDVTKKTVCKKGVQTLLKTCYNENPDMYEIGVDEVGRGPLFGRVYTAAVILPKDETFQHFKMKDSKKFTSKKKIEEIAEYIKQHALAWAISYEDERTIEEINILQSTQKSMHSCIKSLFETGDKLELTYNNCQLLIDGNYFKPITHFNKTRGMVESIPYVCIEGGDNKYTSIAAASILAKVARDQYIDELCELHPELKENYSIHTNKGYGAKKHLDGIALHGITIWHRRNFGICKNYVSNIM